MTDGPEILILLIMIAVLGGWGLNIWALVKCVQTSDEVYRSIGKTRGGQMALHIVGIVIYILGAVVGWVWVGTTRKKLLTLENDRLQGSSNLLPPPPPRAS
jgi:hypothetical protein